jgi:hypothetical protein
LKPYEATAKFFQEAFKVSYFKGDQKLRPGEENKLGWTAEEEPGRAVQPSPAAGVRTNSQVAQGGNAACQRR